MIIARLIIGRIASSFLTLLLVSLLIFLMLEVLPGDVATRVLGRDATPESVAVLRERLNLDDPAYLRYLTWLGNFVTGEFGHSLISGRPVVDILGPRIFNTLLLAAYAFILYIPLATLPALVQAVTRDRPLDHALSLVTLVLLSMPDFLLATVLLITFVLAIPVLPAISLVDHSSSALEYFRAMTLPAVTLAIVMAVYAVRMLRDNLIEVLDSEYVRMAELKGVPARRVVVRELELELAPLPVVAAPDDHILAPGVGGAVQRLLVVCRSAGWRRPAAANGLTRHPGHDGEETGEEHLVPLTEQRQHPRVEQPGRRQV